MMALLVDDGSDRAPLLHIQSHQHCVMLVTTQREVFQFILSLTGKVLSPFALCLRRRLSTASLIDCNENTTGVISHKPITLPSKGQGGEQLTCSSNVTTVCTTNESK